jgi:hypothetical protein
MNLYRKVCVVHNHRNLNKTVSQRRYYKTVGRQMCLNAIRTKIKGIFTFFYWDFICFGINVMEKKVILPPTSRTFYNLRSSMLPTAGNFPGKTRSISIKGYLKYKTLCVRCPTVSHFNWRNSKKNIADTKVSK